MPRRQHDQTLSQTEFQILLALADEDRHGYGIMQEVARGSEGSIRLGPGALYGAMKRLLADGLVEESRKRPKDDDVRRRCYYHLTRTGRAAVSEQAERLALLIRAAVDKRVLSLKIIPVSS
jgi:DNA-binding PadR family transcriptional regulator